MNLAPVVARLQEQVPAFRLVGGAADFMRAATGLTTHPAAFVLPARERAQDNPFGNQVVQQVVDAEFGVLIACRDLSDAQGAAAAGVLQPLRDSVFDALLNWQPDAAADGCEYVSGAITAFDNGVLWWADTYRTSYTIRSQ